MNAAAKTLSQGNIFRGDFSFLSNLSINLLIMALWVAVISSSLAVVYVKNLERHYVHQSAQLTKQNSHLEIERSQLLLEKTMWSAPRRIQGLAKRHFNMVLAKPKAVIHLHR